MSPITTHLYKIQAYKGESFFRIYDDWLALIVAAFAKEEADYMKVMERYGPREAGKDHPADHFAKAMGELMLQCQTASAKDKTFPDFLGQIYEEESITNKYKSQFFTPEPMCQMMAALTMKDLPKQAISVHDPACGSGRCLIAAMPYLPLKDANYYGTDLDLTCVHMTTINMLLRNVDAFIIHGNTLSLEVYGGYATRYTVMGGEVRKLSPELARSLLVRSVEAIAKKQETVIGTPEKVQQVQEAAQDFVANKRGQFDMGF